MRHIQLAVLYSLLPVVFVSRAAAAGQKDAEPWPPISAEELALKDNPAEPGAGAILLYRESFTDDTKGYGTHLYRIKVLTDEGKKYADVEIPYFENLNHVEEIRARTVQSDGKVVDFNGQVFDRPWAKAKKLKIQAKAFSLPDVHTGSIIEYSYKVRWHNRVPDLLKHPGDYIFREVFTFPTENWVLQHELFTRRARFSFHPLKGSKAAWTTYRLPEGAEPRTQPDGAVRTDVENISAFQEEEDMPPGDEEKPRVYFYYLLGFFGDPETFWRSQARQYAEVFEKFMDKPKAMEREVKEIVKPGDSDETKLRKIYARAQQIRYLSYEHAKTEKEEKRENLKENKNVEDVLKRGYASANEINLLFTALCRAAGYDASVVQVAGRNSRFFKRDLLEASQLSAMVVLVRVGSTDVYFDPATLYCPFKLLPWEETGVVGLRADKLRGAFVATTQPVSADAIVERKAELQLDKEGALEGKLGVTFSGQEALTRRLENREKDEQGRRKELEDEVRGWLPAGAGVELKSVSNWEKSDESLFAEFHLKIQNFGTSTGRRLLLPMAICQARAKYPFQNAKRVHPIYFRYPYWESDDITFQLPASYHVESLPASRQKATDFGHYETSYANQAAKIHFERHLVMDGIFFPLTAYPALRVFFDAARAGDEQQAVLKVEDAAGQK